MKKIEIGEWVTGPFLDATIEGFIAGEDCSTYSILISGITESENPHPELEKQSILKVDKNVVDHFFRTMNKEQQEELIALAIHLEQFPWASDLTFRFLPFPSNSNQQSDDNTKTIFSNVLNKMLALTKEDQDALFEHYLGAVKKGFPARVEAAEEINCTDVLDGVISAIILIGDEKQGIHCVKNLVNGRKAQRI